MTIIIEATVLFSAVWFVAGLVSRVIGLWRSLAKNRHNPVVIEAAVVAEVKAIAPTTSPKFTAEVLQSKKRDELRDLCRQVDIKWWKGAKGTNMTIPEMRQNLLEVAYG